MSTPHEHEYWIDNLLISSWKAENLPRCVHEHHAIIRRLVRDFERVQKRGCVPRRKKYSVFNRHSTSFCRETQILANVATRSRQDPDWHSICSELTNNRRRYLTSGRRLWGNFRQVTRDSTNKRNPRASPDADEKTWRVTTRKWFWINHAPAVMFRFDVTTRSRKY